MIWHESDKDFEQIWDTLCVNESFYEEKLDEIRTCKIGINRLKKVITREIKENKEIVTYDNPSDWAGNKMTDELLNAQKKDLIKNIKKMASDKN